MLWIFRGGQTIEIVHSSVSMEDDDDCGGLINTVLDYNNNIIIIIILIIIIIIIMIVAVWLTRCLITKAVIVTLTERAIVKTISIHLQKQSKGHPPVIIALQCTTMYNNVRCTTMNYEVQCTIHHNAQYSTLHCTES